MSVRSRKVARELLGNRARTILVVAALAIGLTGLSTTLRARAIFTANLDTQLVAANPSSATILTDAADQVAVDRVTADPDVAEATGRLVVFGRIATADENRQLRLVVLDDLAAEGIDRLQHDAGAWPPPDGSLVLERSSLGSTGLDVGEVATVTDPAGGVHAMAVTATAYDIGIVSGKLVDQVVFGYTSSATWRQLGLPGGYNEISFRVTGDRLDDERVFEIATRASDDLARNGNQVLGLRVPPPGKHVLDNVVTSLLLILGSLGLLSLVLSGFLVFNTVTAMLARQRSQIGVMKAVGASRRQVLSLYLSTVGVYSVMSLLIAVPTGSIAARLLTRQLGDLLNIDIVDFGAPAWVWIVEISIGLFVPVLAALGPILAGTRATVAEAIRGGESAVGFGEGRIDRGLARLPGLSTAARYAARNTFRRKARLALTVVALSLGGAILVTVLSLRSSLLATVDSVAAYWQQDVTVDLQTAVPYSALAPLVESTDGVDAVEGWLIMPASIIDADGREAGEQTIVFGVPPETNFIAPTLRSGRWLDPVDTSEVVVNVDVAANRPGLRVGDRLTLRIGGFDTTWNLSGVSTTQLVAPGEPRPSVPIAYVPYRSLDAAFGSSGAVNRLIVGGTEHDAASQAALAAQIESDLSDAGVQVRSVETRHRMRAQVERLTTPILLLLVSMAMLFALVGGLGLLGTMSLNVLERTTEFGMVRAVGATGRTVVSIVLVEGLSVAALSWVLGSVLAIPLGWTMAQAVGVSFIKVPLDFQFAPLGVLAWLVLAVVVAVIASWIPARSASRLSVRDAIAYE